MKFKYFVLCAIGLTTLRATISAVSFYGESYVHIPYNADLRQTDIELRFKASRPYGVLLLLAGSSRDFLLLQLHAGTVQLKVNFGSEDTVLDLGRHRYDDLQWHTVKVTRSSEVISMVVDDSTTVRERILGTYRELNMNMGIYLGGVDVKANELFKHELKHFRGTFSTLTLNDLDLVEMGRGITDPNNVREISWDIDPIFNAPRDSPISLTSDTSFVSFSHIHPTNERTVSFLLKTQSPKGLLLYSYMNIANEKHYIALEMINHQLKLTVGRNKTVVSLKSETVIENCWHQIDISVSPTYLELVVDGEKYLKQLSEKLSAIYGGTVFVGGLSQSARAVSRYDDLESLQANNSIKGSVIGCVHKLIINSRACSLQDIYASRLISTDCGGSDDCHNGRCGIEPPGSASAEFTPHSDSNREEFQLLAVNPVIVNEGAETVLTTDNIEMVYDYKNYGIRESGIIFYVAKKPKFGEIEVDLGRRRNGDVFTYLDITGQKVKYKHSGSEHVYDEILIEVEFVISTKASDDFPERLQQKYDFVLPVNVKPSNDAPVIVLGNSGVLKIIENTKVLIGPEFLHADDSDNPSNELVYSVTQRRNQGYFERSGQSGIPTTSFTQAEINDHRIWFLHIGTENAEISLNVTDGIAYSSPVTIYVQTVTLNLTVLKNTGILLPHNSFSLITRENLTTVSNAPSQEVEILYDVRKPPRYGVIEKQQQFAEGEWQETGTFAQRHIDNGHIRYRALDHAVGRTSDEFMFTVNAKSYTTPFSFFRIHFEQIYLRVEERQLSLMHKSYAALSNENLKAYTNNPQLRPENIQYELARPPSMGNFYRMDLQQFTRHMDFANLTPLSYGESFTQQDINSGSVYYNLKASAYENVKDFTDLRVSTLGTSAKNVRLWIEFVPQKNDVTFVNNGLKDVIEGGRKYIDRDDLYLQTDKFRVFEFTVISRPHYGVLHLIDPRSAAIVSHDVGKFTTDDIRDTRLVYQHDDSEHGSDSFTFTAVPDISKTSPSHGNIPEFTGTFDIQMLMRNDNPPERKVDKVFTVERNGQKLLTIRDLAFIDPDIDYDPLELLYTRRRVSNGQFISARKGSQIYQFKQVDLVNNEIMFKHSGEDIGRADIAVTDGQFYSNCMMQIQAGEPFIQIDTNTGIKVRNGRREKVTIGNLSIETNMNLADTEVHFVLFEGPRNGFLEVDGVKVDEFILKNLKMQNLVYKHKGKSNEEDYFAFTLIAKDIQVNGNFSIQILLESSQIPPRVVNNHVLEVFAGREMTVIEKRHLLVTHSDSSEQDLEFLVLVLPKEGSLLVGNEKLTADGEMTFTQADINNGNLKYKPETMTATSDQFVFEVSNGLEALRGLEFLINIVPYSLSMSVQNFTVIEGGQKALSTQIITVDTKLSQNQSLVFSVKHPPTFGRIEVTTRRGEAVTSFTATQLSRQEVCYVHDNSENKMDQFSVCVKERLESYESETQTVYISVEGINDEAPIVVRNTGLTVWRGSMTKITAQNLLALDADNSAAELTYLISKPTNGHVALLNNTFKGLISFRQAWVDDGQLVFVHNGSNDGKFTFEVSDGPNKSNRSDFLIIAKPLVLTCQVHELLHAYPNTLQPITAQQLMTSTNDANQTKPIIYMIVSEPKHGSLVSLEEGVEVKVKSFTQKDINSSLIYYKHSGSLQGWTQNDSIEFQVNTLYAEPLRDLVLDVYVSYGNLNAENKNQLIKTSPIKVDEGGEMIVAKNNLDVTEFIRNLERLGKHASLRFSLKEGPKHGQLLYSGSKLNYTTRFRQWDINSHKLIYKHDDSDTVADAFFLNLHLRIEEDTLAHSSDQETMFGLVLNVTVKPVNDETFRLVTRRPSLNIVQGFSAVIDQSVLYVTDNDTTPEYLVYEIFSEANNGYVAYVQNMERKITSFTQQDVNKRRVIFKHNFHSGSGIFYFRVSDGRDPFIDSFTINVSSIFVHITNNDTIQLVQSNTSVKILQDNCNVSTNGLRDKVVYIVTRQPRYGRIYINGKNSQNFSQADVDENRVTYFQIDKKFGSDLFEYSLLYIHDQYSKVTFYEGVVSHIQVTPLVKMRALEAPKGERVAITLLSLDASVLAERTGDDPVFTVQSGPFHGQIIKTSLTKRQLYTESYVEGKPFKAVKVFSHEDVVYMKVFYKSDIHNTRQFVQDNFTYVLTSFDAQPATGVFYVGLVPSESIPIVPVTNSPGKDVKTDSYNTVPHMEDTEDMSSGNDTLAPSRLKHDHVIILAVSVPLIVVVVCIIVLVYFAWRSRRKQEYTPTSKKSPRLRPNISGPYQIEQPHVHIEPQTQADPDSEDSHSLIVEYENTHHIPNSSRTQSEDGDVIMPMSMSLPSASLYASVCKTPRSPDISRTVVSSTVPTCKVTPLVSTSPGGGEELEGAVGGCISDSNSLGSMSEMIDWITSDPELLEHCRSSSPPVLRNSQYWV